MNNWEQIANDVESEYGGYVDWYDRFFICPECEEPIYECDWENSDFVDKHGDFICPVCEGIIE